MSDVASQSFTRIVEPRYRTYGRYVLGFRHFAEGRDGLLPVQRRALYAMNKIGARSRSSMTKTAKAGSYTSGAYHPHGESNVYGAIANMTQFAMTYPLVAGVGNFGWHNAPPSAPRYTSVYLSEYANTLFDQSELSQVVMDRTYDGSDVEPRFLPARVPHLLLSGCRSISPGYSGNIPPLTLDWVIDAVKFVLDGKTPRPPRDTSYRWGGIMSDLEPSWLRTGKASATFRPVLSHDERGLAITSLSPGLSDDRIATLMEKFPGLASISEESPRPGELVRIVVLPKRGYSSAQLLAHAREVLYSRESFQFVYIDQFSNSDGEPDYRPMTSGGPLDFLRQWTKWRLGVVSGAAEFRRRAHLAEIDRLELMLLVIAKRAELLKALGLAKDKPDLTSRVRKILRCTPEQAATVVDLAFHRLATMNVGSLRSQIAHHKAEARMEAGITKNPQDRMVADMEVVRAAITRDRTLLAAKFKS